MWSPDAFMFKEFSIHASIFGLPIKDQYMMLSSGANQLSMPAIWKESLKKEIDLDFLYQWYTSSTGFQTVKRAVETYENFLFSRGNIFFKSHTHACMTIGASQAAFYSVAYLYSIGCNKMLFIGMNYPLYERVGKRYSFGMKECRSKATHRTTPTPEEINESIVEFEPDVLVFSYPNNPSGEKYSDCEFMKILNYASNHGAYCIIDCVCNMLLSAEEVTYPEPLIVDSGMLDRTIIVNSFSKTDSVPGFRIGYVLGNKALIDYVSTQQADCIMNPQTIPVIPIWVTLLFRCLHLSIRLEQTEKQRNIIVRYFKRLFFVTTAIAPRPIKEYIEELTGTHLQTKFLEYEREMLQKEEVYLGNHNYACEKLREFITAATNMESGFNFLIKLKPMLRFSEIDICHNLLVETGIAILTESAFSLHESQENNYWIRISLACPCDLFISTIDKLYDYLLRIQEASNDDK
jgi:aspartate/methionine/tyrosine aminotransferase